MKKILLATLLCATAFSAHAIDVGVSIGIGDPNFYGTIDLGGNYPPPQVVYAQPVVIQPAVGIAVEPIYLHVPIAHSSNWRRYCGLYNACGRPVYFVRDDWYRNTYAPRYISAHQILHDEVRHEEVRHDDHRAGEEHRHEDGR